MKGQRPVCDIWGKQLGECGRKGTLTFSPGQAFLFPIWYPRFESPTSHAEKLTVNSVTTPTRELTLGLLDALEPRALLRL